MKSSTLLLPMYLADISDITIIKKPIKNNRFWNLLCLNESLFDRIRKQAIKTILGIKKGFMSLLNNSSSISFSALFSHKK